MNVNLAESVEKFGAGIRVGNVSVPRTIGGGYITYNDNKRANIYHETIFQK